MSHTLASIGIDVGGTKLLAGLVDQKGAILEQWRFPTRSALLLDDIVAAAESTVGHAREAGIRLAGIGVGIKGFVDARRGRLVRSMSLGVEDLDIADALMDRISLPAFVENDVHASALGELTFGLGRRHRSFIVFNAGTGISAGFVLDGRLVRGAGGMAGEIGHMVVSVDHVGRCACGRIGCLEDLIIRSRRGEPVPLARDDRFGDLDVAYRLLATGLVNLINSFNPSAVALMGGMLANNPGAAEGLAAAVRRLCLPSAAAGLAEIVPAAGGYAAGLLGAGALPFVHAPAATRPAEGVAGGPAQ